MKKSNQLSQEDSDFINAMQYHGQLLTEIKTLFLIYCSMCGEHAKNVEPALARAIFFTLFGSIEASCRIYATSTLLADTYRLKIKHRQPDDPIRHLSASEKYFLRQETEEISTNDWTPHQKSKFVSFHDALVGYPTIYSRLFGLDLSIDKSCAEWHDLIRLKQLRDLGAHVNVRKMSKSVISIKVTYKDLKRLLECRLWFCNQLTHLPWIAEIESKNEIDFLKDLLEAGFSDKCRKIRGERFALLNTNKKH